MATNAVWLKVDGQGVAHALCQVREKLEGANGELVVDFSSVRRVEPSALTAMEELASSAEAKGVKLVLRGVSVDVYKVLKLVRLTPRFSFLN